MDLNTIRHSLAHVMAAVVTDMFPGTRLAIGPSIDNGFYYDFDFTTDFSGEQLKEIEKRMKKFLKKNHAFEHYTLPVDEALAYYEKEENPYKVELITELKEKGETEVSFYKVNDFVDLCKGPHVEKSKEIPFAFKLDKTAGAYWRGDEKNKMLTRIYGLAFETKEELAAYIAQREEALRRDHRKLGQELELFVIHENVGKGLPMLLPKGATLRRILERFTVDEELARGYLHVYTPDLGRKYLYETSGHWAHYKDSMYPPMDVDGEEYVLRPMSCPHHFTMYSSKPHSYRELPVRYAEIAKMYRKERSGELTGLIRVMGFTLADGHIICRPDQLKEEFIGIVDMITYFMDTLGIRDKCSFRASLRDKAKDKYVDDDAGWEYAETTLLELLDEMGIPYEKAVGDAAFYGPKLDIQLKTVSGKEETIFTNQIDMVLAERFDLTYKDANNEKVRPLILHRSSIGCFERTMAFLIEHYGGAFPLWFSPVHIRLLTISEKQEEFAKEVQKRMLKAGIRVEIDVRNESLNRKIREARMLRYPYVGVIGDKEMEEDAIMIRNRDTGEQTKHSVEEIITTIATDDREHNLTLSL